MRNSFEYVDKHPLNTSKTKQTHAFSKSPRFKYNHQPTCRTAFYNLSKSDVHLNKTLNSSFKFSRQRRFLQSEKQNRQFKLTPSPLSYDIPSFSELSMKKKKGVPFNQSPKSKNKVEYLPGPATYQPEKYNPEHIKSACITSQRRKQLKHWNGVGPGQYDPQKNLNSTKKITIGNEQRFKYKYQQHPSPSTYYRQRKFNEDSYVHGRSPKFTFGTSPRNKSNARKSTSPGPGSYNNSFSEFSERSKRIYQILNRL